MERQLFLGGLCTGTVANRSGGFPDIRPYSVCIFDLYGRLGLVGGAIDTGIICRAVSKVCIYMDGFKPTITTNLVW